MAKTMLCHVLERPGELRLRELPRPEPGAGEIVLHVRAALTCGTDVKAFVRGHPKFPMPTPFGHEFAGVVAAVGAGVTDLREGDAIMATPTAPCGACFYCDREQENLCETVMATMVRGAFGEFVRLPAHIVRRNTFRKPESLSFAEAALLEPLACVMHGLASVALHPDDTVVLLGAGAISLLHVLALKAMGAARVVVVGRGSTRVERARALGADLAVAGGVDAARDVILQQTSGRGADVVIECTGQVEVWQQAMGLVRRGGHVVFFGGCPPGTNVEIDTQRFHYDEIRLSSPFHFTPRAVRRSFELLCRPDFGGARLITATYPLADVATALERHRSGDGVKFAIVPEV